MSKKEDLKESIMLDMKKTIGIVTKHERQVDLTIRALESENKIDKNMSYKEKEASAKKVIVDDFIVKDVGISPEEWEEMIVEKIHLGIRKEKSGTKV